MSNAWGAWESKLDTTVAEHRDYALTKRRVSKSESREGIDMMKLACELPTVNRAVRMRCDVVMCPAGVAHPNDRKRIPTSH